MGNAFVYEDLELDMWGFFCSGRAEVGVYFSTELPSHLTVLGQFQEYITKRIAINHIVQLPLDIRCVVNTDSLHKGHPFAIYL